jgi:hypothetical protein
MSCIYLTFDDIIFIINKVKVTFRGEQYQVVFTDHAVERMKARNVSKEDVLLILKKGTVLPKEKRNLFWVYLSFRGRKDNQVCLSISLEKSFLIVITTLVNWRPS